MPGRLQLRGDRPGDPPAVVRHHDHAAGQQARVGSVASGRGDRPPGPSAGPGRTGIWRGFGLDAVGVDGFGSRSFRPIRRFVRTISTTRSTIAPRVLARERASIVEESVEPLEGRHRVAEGAEDLDPLDRVDPEVGLEVEVELEHLRRIARPVADDLDQPRRHGLAAERIGGGRRGRFSTGDRDRLGSGRDGRTRASARLVSARTPRRDPAGERFELRGRGGGSGDGIVPGRAAR